MLSADPAGQRGHEVQLSDFGEDGGDPGEREPDRRPGRLDVPAKDASWAGLLYGITAALAVPFLQCLPDAWKDTKAIYQAPKAKAKDAQEHVEEHQEDPAVSSEPATGTT